MTTWKQVVYDVADAYREADGSTAKIPVGSLADKVREGAGIPYTGDNPLTIGQNGYIFEPKTLLKDGLTIINGVEGEDLTETEARQSAAVASLMSMVKRKVSESKNNGLYVWEKYSYKTEISATNVVSTSDGFTVTLDSEYSTEYVAGGEIVLGVDYMEHGDSPDGLYHHIFASDGNVYDPYFDDGDAPIGTVPLGTWSISGNTITAEGWFDVRNETISSYTSITFANPLLFDSYVVSDVEDAYPNGGELDGYYYEKGESGEYVWKKCERVAPITLSFTQTQTYPMIVKVSSDDVDLTKVDGSFFVGVKMDTPDTGIDIEFLDNMKVLYNTTEMAYTYTASTCQIEINNNPGNIYSWNDYTKEAIVTFLDYVVSDDPTAYPDKAIQDGYWYERVSEEDGITPEIFGCSRMAVDTFVYSSSTVANGVTLNHSLNDVPKVVLITVKNRPSAYYNVGNMLAIVTATNQLSGGIEYYTSQIVGGSASGTVTSTTIKLSLSVNAYFITGAEYQLITMA